MTRHRNAPLTIFALLTTVFTTQLRAADKPIKTFILAGQSNMVGWGDSTKIPDDLRKGNDQNKNGFIEVDELGGLHQIRMNDPKGMRERLLSEDLRKPPKDKRPRDPADGP